MTQPESGTVDATPGAFTPLHDQAPAPGPIVSFITGRVSLVIPTKDRGTLLAETLDSVAAQTYPEWEALVIDDGSSDHTADLMRDWCGRDPRVRYLQRTGGTPGGCAARNQGAAAASGEFIVFLDADDLLAPHCLQQRVALLRDRPELDFLVTNGFVFNQIPGDTPLLWNADSGEPDIDRYLRRDIPWQTTSATLRRRAIETVGPWDEAARSGQDWDYYLRALLLGCRYERGGEPDFYWRAPSTARDSIGSRARAVEHLRHRATMIERVYQLMRQHRLLTPRRERLLTGQFVWYARQQANANDVPGAIRTWRRARACGLVGRRRYLEFAAHLRYRHRIGRLTQRRLDRWPAEIFLQPSATHMLTPVDRGSAPAVSILTAVYNGREFLARSLDSVLGQTFGDFEFIIIDDGSTDGATDLLREYAARDPRVRLVTRANKGLTVSLNEGLRLARGTYVARFDADDLCDPQRLERQVKFMRAHPEVVLLGGAYALIDAQDRLLTTLRPPADDGTLQQQCLEGTTPICHPLAMFRRDAALQVGGYDESYTVAQDLDFWLRLGEVGQMACLPDLLLRYRMHGKSASEQKQAQQVANMKRASETAQQRRRVQAVFKGAGGWRAENNAAAQMRQLLKYGWWAWNSGQRTTARSYGLRAIRSHPLSKAGWKLLACTLARPTPAVKD